MSLLHIQVKTLDGEVTLEVKKTIRGEKLFNMVCASIGLSETWYFGILLENNNSFSWLRNDKRLHRQIKDKEVKPLLFLVKFYPVYVKDLKLMSTKYLFYLQIKYAIITENIFCPDDVSVLLASYILKIQHGDFEFKSINVSDLIPNSVLRSYNFDFEMWKNLLMVWFNKLDGLSKDEAITEYLEICKDLAMFGINYFSVKSKNKIELWLGVTTHGIKLYNKHDFLKPNISYDWHEILNVCVSNKVLKIKFIKNKKGLKLFVEPKIIDELFHMLVENHEFYLNRHESKISEYKIHKEKVSSLNVEESHIDNCREIQKVINCYKLLFNEMKQSYKELEAINNLLSEKCNLAEEEAIILSSIISTKFINNSKQIIQEVQLNETHV